MIEGLNKTRAAKIEVRDTGIEHGRGVFATKNIPKHSYICEYRSNLTPDQSQKQNEEYTVNDKGCYVLEGQVGSKWLMFDATRKLNQFGR